MAESEMYYCEKCHRTLKKEEFYSSKNLEKYPNEGKFPQCKKCMTMHVDNWNPDTYLWILQEADVPYIPEEWNKLMATYAKDRSKVTGMTIIGRYLSKMKLKQFRDFRWKDNEFLEEMAKAKIEQAMKKQGYEAAEIAMAVEEASNRVPEVVVYNPPPQEPVFEPEVDLDLTDEDKMYLRLKWGKTYRPEEWVQLEQLYQDMTESYDIQQAGHVDTLKLICKTSLKANQLIDMGDVEGFQKMSKVYDSLMKSGNFTAAQNKSESGEYVDSISELVAICESEGFIPRYYTDGPQDKVDRVLQDLQEYTRSLVTEEMNLGNLIETAVKQIELDKEKEAQMEADAADDDEAMEMSLFSDNPESYIQDEDYEEFKELEDSLELEDDEFVKSVLEGTNE